MQFKMNFSLHFIIFFYIILNFPVIAVTTDSISPFEYTQQTKLRLDQLKLLPPEKYLEEMESYRKSIERYIQHKKGVCNGEFSVFILSGQKVNPNPNEDDSKDERLSQHERLLCFRELKALHVTFVNNSFAARRRFIKYQHQQLLVGLDRVREKVIDGIHKSYSEQSLKKQQKRSRSKKRRSKRRRRSTKIKKKKSN
jgi:hypothetical protein